ncbi:MAG: hypothetical protein LBG79_06105 [Spirochaetaceae bacterium]|jgi:hypothetical protein|nr:hypothetical protein [Spirochaetaceae bacterium]
MKPGFFFIIFYAAIIFCSCSERRNALLWTCRPEIAVYANYYNTQQNGYKIEVRYVEQPLHELLSAKKKPDIIVSNYIYNRAAFNQFANLNSLFKNKLINKDVFYPALLEAGRDKNAQRVIPISFNAPLIVFLKEMPPGGEDSAFIDIAGLEKEGIEFNKRDESGIWQRIGFSPLWEKQDAFIYLIACLYNTEFNESYTAGSKENTVSWNEEALQESIETIKTWIKSSTGGIQAEDDFIYKYFFDPAIKLVMNGRIRFASMSSDEFWNLDSANQSAFDIKWVCRNQMIPVAEEIPSFAIYKNAKAKKAAEHFAAWFFNETTQDMLLEKSRQTQLKTINFGIAGGFSAMRSVTEFFFPKYYEGLLGRTPPAASLVPPARLNENWPAIKKDVILPYISQAVRESSAYKSSLPELIVEWNSKTRGSF